MLVCDGWLENHESGDFQEVDEKNFPICKESQKQGTCIASIKQGDDRLSIKTFLLHLS